MDATQELENILDSGSCRIADAANTYNWALTIIKSKGYKTFLYPAKREEHFGDFWAIKEQRVFIGADPLRLLGIIALWETLGDNWQTQDKLAYESLYDEISKMAFPSSVVDIEKLNDKEFSKLVADYRIFFNSFDQMEKLPLNITRQTFFNIIDNYYKEEKSEK
jgi:hypothetical protein